jgi:hypothetical protein
MFFEDEILKYWYMNDVRIWYLKQKIQKDIVWTILI